MKLNVFEGARRIALLIGGLWALGWVAYAILSEPYSRVRYSVHRLGATPVLVENCADNDGHEYITARTSDGDDISVDLCFVARKADNGEMLIPYAPAEGGKVWMGQPYSTEVRDYTRGVGQSFQLDERGVVKAKELRRAALLDQWKTAMLFLFGGLAVGWGFVAATGWVVRGFMRIPRGKDERP